MERSRLQRVKYCDITPGISTSDKIIEGVVVNRCPLQTTNKRKLLKAVIQEDETHTQLTVFFFEKYAEMCVNIKQGDKISMSNITVESSTVATKHPCQILVDPSDSNAVLEIEKAALNPNRGMFVSSFDVNRGPSVSANKNPKDAKTGLSSAKQYTYTLLKDVKMKTAVNIYGVVKYVRPPMKSRGTDYMMVLSLTDTSFHDEYQKLKCLLFNKDLHQLPAVKHVGDIVRFHRLNIEEFRGDQQGQNGPGFAWLVFGGCVGDTLEPRASSSTIYNVSDQEKQKITALREWKSEELNLSQEEKQRISTLSQVTSGAYLDLTCQVIGSVLLKPKALLLMVWDGTKVNLPVMKESVQESIDDNNTDIPLYVRAKSYMYHVKVFDEHVNAATRIKPGDVILLRNLHAAKYKPDGGTDNSSVLPTIEFCLHTGSTYNRGLEILPAHNRDVMRLKMIFNEIPVPSDLQLQINNYRNERRKTIEDIDDICMSLDDGAENVPMDANTKSEDIVHTAIRSRDNPCNPEKAVVIGNTQDSETRCMQTTATIITDHNHVKISTIKDVLNGKCPYKYRLRAKVVNLQPDAGTIEHFLKLYCSSCHFLASYDSFTSKEPVSVINQVKYYSCPNCQALKDSTQNKGSKQLEYIYMLQMILQDKSGQIMVQLWKTYAVQFFDNIEPRRLLKNKSLFQEIQAGLDNLQGISRSKESKTTDSNSGRKQPPWMECCIMSYTTEYGKCYQIFDTVLCMDDSSS